MFSKLSRKPSIYVTCSNVVEINRQFESLPDDFSLVYGGDPVTDTVGIVTISVENNGSADIVEEDIVSDFKIELPDNFKPLSVSIGETSVLDAKAKIDVDGDISVHWRLLKVRQTIPIAIIGTYIEKNKMPNFNKEISFKSFLRDIDLTSRRKPLWSTVLKFISIQTLAFPLVFLSAFFLSSSEKYISASIGDEVVAIRTSSITNSGVVSVCSFNQDEKLLVSCVDALESNIEVERPLSSVGKQYVGVNIVPVLGIYMVVFVYITLFFFLLTMRESKMRRMFNLISFRSS